MTVPPVRAGFRRSPQIITTQVKRAVKKRDGKKCVECGATKHLTIHHKQPISAGGSAMDMRNMETLCKTCHGRRHR